MSFDLIVITSSNPVQLQLFELELAALPALKGARILAVTDPQGHRVGSGGGTLNALVAANALAPLTSTSRTLVLHSGGDSQRSPLCTVQGKAFSSLPHAVHATPLARLLDVLAAVTRSPGVIVSSTDVLLHLPDLAPTELAADCVAGLGIYSPFEYGLRHGVFARHSILQKASAEQLREAGFTKDQVLLDSGVIFFGPALAKELLALAAHAPYSGSTLAGLDQGHAPYRFELYTDILLSLPQFHKTEPTPLSVALCKAHFVVIEAPPSSRFVHSGTTLELVALATQPPEFAGFTRRVHALAMPHQDVHETAVVINSLLRGTAQHSRVEANAVVEHCDLFGTYCIGAGSVASRVNVLPGLVLPPRCCVQQIPLAARRGTLVFPCFGVLDTVKDEAGKGGTFMNVSWETVLAQLPASELWPPSAAAAAAAVRNLWTAKLFPVIDPASAVERDAALMLLQLGDGGIALDRLVLATWQALPRVALADLAMLFDPVAFFEHRARVLPTLILQRAWANTLAVSLPVPPHNKELLRSLDGLMRAHASDFVTLARLASLMGDVLADASSPVVEGAANALFTATFNAVLDVGGLAAVDRLLAMRDLFLHSALDRARAAAHMNRLSQLLVHRSMAAPADRPLPVISQPLALNTWAHASCPARIDLGGGWSDTPPVTFEHGGAVTNMAILVDGEHALGASCRLMAARRIDLWLGKMDAAEKAGARVTTLAHPSDFAGFNDPASPCALLKCVLLAFFNGDAAALFERLECGVQLCAWSNLPVGSGLGGSSIVAACAVGVVARALGLDESRLRIVDWVLTVEQLLSSGGGWQDQIGGIFPGVKIARAPRGLPVRLDVQPVELPTGFTALVESRMALLNTGQARLARDLLQRVLKKWARRDEEMVGCVDALVGNAERGAIAASEGDLEALARELALFWSLKRTIAGAAQAEPEHVTGLFKALEPSCLACSLCGAGGGGFAVVVLRDGVSVDDLRARVADWNALGRGPEVAVKRLQVCTRGLVVGS